jgi:hypothetical protein
MDYKVGIIIFLLIVIVYGYTFMRSSREGFQASTPTVIPNTCSLLTTMIEQMKAKLEDAKNTGQPDNIIAMRVAAVDSMEAQLSQMKCA